MDLAIPFPVKVTGVGAVLVGCLPLVAPLVAQEDGFQPRFEGVVAQWVESGRLSEGEGFALLAHLEATGLPRLPGEAHAVAGLSRESAQMLEQEAQWIRWCTASGEARAGSGSGARFRAALLAGGVSPQQAGVRTGEWVGPGWGQSVRLGRSGAWAFRCDRGAGERGVDHVAGHVTLQRGPIRGLLGDHVIRWGQGLVGWSSSAYDGVRDPTVVHAMTRWVVPLSAGDALPVRRGLAAWREEGPWQWAVTGSLARLALRWEDGQPATWYRDGLHRTEAQRSRATTRVPRLAAAVAHQAPGGLRWGLAAELGRAGLPPGPVTPWTGLASCFATGNWASLRWGGEAAAFPGGWRTRAGAIFSDGPARDAFVGLSAGEGTHPGTGWGDAAVPAPGPEAVAGMLWRHPGKNRGRLWIRATWEPTGSSWEGEWRRNLRTPSGPLECRLLLRGDPAHRLAREVRAEAHWEHPEGLRFRGWIQAAPSGPGLRGSWGGGAVGGWHPTGGPWDVDVVWVVHRLEPGVLWFRLQPEAARWTSSVLSGAGTRWGVCLRRALGRRGEVGWSLYRSDRFGTRTQGSGDTETLGPVRHAWQLHAAFAL